MIRKRTTAAIAGGAAALLTLAACGGDGNGGGNGDGDGPLSGATIIVGSKEFTEQRLLGQMTAVLLENAGASVTDRKSTRLNSSHVAISYAVFCLKKKKTRIKRV